MEVGVESKWGMGGWGDGVKVIWKCGIAWLHGCMVAWLHGCMDAWKLDCPDAIWFVISVFISSNSFVFSSSYLKEIH
jgi:hypothetical protein